MESLRLALVQCGVLAATGNLLALVSILVGAQDRTHGLAVVVMTAAILPWTLGVALQSVPEIYVNFASVIDSLTLSLFWIPPAALHLACQWTHRHDCRLSRHLLVGAYSFGAVGCWAQWRGWVDLGVPTDRGWGVLRGGPAGWHTFAIQSVFLFVCLAISTYWCWQRLSEESPEEHKLGAKAWLLAAFLFVTFALGNYLAVFGLPALPTGAIGNLLFLGVLAGFMIRYGFLRMDPEVAWVSLAVSFAVAAGWIVTGLWWNYIGRQLLSAGFVGVQLAAATVGAACVLGYGLARREQRLVHLRGGGPLRAALDDAFPLVAAKLRAASQWEEVSGMVLNATGLISGLCGAAVYRRLYGGRSYQLDAYRGEWRFSSHATRDQLERGLLKVERAKGIAPLQVRDKPDQGVEALALTCLGEGADGMGSLHLVSVPVPRLGHFEGYLVVWMATNSVSRAEMTLLQALAVLLSTCWYNLDLQNDAERQVTADSGRSLRDVNAETKTAQGKVCLGKRVTNPGDDGNDEAVRDPNEPPELRMIIGKSPALMQALESLKLVSRLPVSVFLYGETGTGKELFARAVHALSPRNGKPFKVFNCAALSPSLAESELFGHARGAFTGATEAKVGWFEAATGGTLFLDEIADFPLDMQAKLLRAIEQGEIVPVGSTNARKVDVRVICASNRSLQELKDEGRFREDLHERLCVSVVRLPPLRERLEDIPLLVRHFLQKFVAETRAAHCVPEVTDDAWGWFESRTWPGNIRELRSIVYLAAGCSEGAPITAELLEAAVRSYREGRNANPTAVPLQFPVNLKRPLSQAIRQYKSTHVKAALDACEGNLAATARVLGLTKGNLVRLLRSLDVPTNTQSPSQGS